MPIVVACSCGKKLNVRDELVGRKVKCPACGGVIKIESDVAEVVEVVEEAPPRPKPPPPVPGAKTAATSRVPAAATKKEAAPALASYWNCTREFTKGLLVVTDDAIWFNKLADKELKRAKKLLDDGEDPEDVFEENSTRFHLAYTTIQEITFNKKLAQMQVSFPGTDEKETTNLYFEDHATRDEAFKELRRRVGADWQYQRRDLNRFQASLSPLMMLGLVILVFGFFVFLAWAFNQPAEDGRPRIVRTSLWGLLVAYTVGWLGPLWTGGVGGIFVVGAVAWMIMRMADPPIEISLKPRPSEAVEDEKEEEDDRPRKKKRPARDDDD